MLKVKFIQDYRVAIDGINIVEFVDGQEAELPKDKAELYAERGVCKLLEEKKAFDPVEQNKMAHPVAENKKKGK